LAFGAGRLIKLKARFYDGAGEHLYETPLSEDQVIEDKGGGTLDVQATVAHTPQLEWWLLGFGRGVEVRAPAQVRRAVEKSARRQVGRKRRTVRA
jgi:hypothetical protein